MTKITLLSLLALLFLFISCGCPASSNSGKANITGITAQTNTVNSAEGQVFYRIIPGETDAVINNGKKLTCNDPYYNKQWALHQIQSLPIQYVDSKVSIAVLDTGIDISHEDVAGKITASVNFSGSSTLEDVNGHGTHVAGIIAASINNSKGIASIGLNQHILNIKVAEDNGNVWPSNIAKGIVWAVDHGAKVINISLYVPSSSQKLEQSISYAWSKGAVIVASAGNMGSSNPTYPAYYDNVLSVGALDQTNNLWSKSNKGTWIKLYSPGTDIYSTLPGNHYGYKSGTSMAAAYVSAVAAQCFDKVNDCNGDGKLNDEVVLPLENIFVARRFVSVDAR